MNDKKKLLISGVFAVIAIVLIICGLSFRTPKHFTDLKVIETDQAAIKNQVKNNTKDGLTYEFVFQPGCGDCQHIEKDTIKPIHKLQRQHKLVVFNAKNQKTKRYLLTNMVDHTPTLIVKYHGYTEYQYTGRNTKKFINLLNGKTTNGKHSLPHSGARPKLMTTENDFMGFKHSDSPTRYNSISKLTEGE